MRGLVEDLRGLVEDSRCKQVGPEHPYRWTKQKVTIICDKNVFSSENVHLNLATEYCEKAHLYQRMYSSNDEDLSFNT